MSIVSMLAQHADMTMQNLQIAGSMVPDAAIHGKLAVGHAANDLVILAQAGDITVEEFRERLENVTQEEQLGWLTAAVRYFIGIFQKGGEAILSGLPAAAG